MEDYLKRFNGIFSDEKDKIESVKYSVIYELSDVYKIGDRLFWQSAGIMSLGTFNDMTMAYGHALLWLNFMFHPKERGSDFYITPLTKLEGDSGYTMSIETKEPIWRDHSSIYNLPEKTIFSRSPGYETVFILVDKTYKEV